MSLLLEIETRGPRYLAGLTMARVVVDELLARGCPVTHPGDWVRLVPRHPDWSGPIRLVLAGEGKLVPGVSPPDLVRAIADRCSKTLPQYGITIFPAIDPTLVFDTRQLAPRVQSSLAPGQLHALLGTNEN
ncbi:MAG: hypothetical protein ABI743_06115 [bacterium]